MPFSRVVITGLVLAATLPCAAPAAGVRFAERAEPATLARGLEGGLRVLSPRAAPFRFNLVGLRWRGAGKVWFRTAGAGGWSSWRPARPEDEDLPDRGSRERAGQHGWTIGNPFWIGSARRIQYRVSASVSQLRTSFVRSASRRVRTAALAGTPGIIPRSSWGANEAIVRSEPYYARSVVFALVHHTAGREPATPEESAAIVRAIQTYHVKSNGWNDIGYNFLVDRFGQIFEGRGGGVDRNVVGAHAEGFNTGSVGVAMIGAYDAGEISAEARTALEALLAWRLDLAHVDPITRVSWISAGNARFPSGVPVSLSAVAGHRDTGFTSCPGNTLYGHLAEIAVTAGAIGLPKLYAPLVSGAVGGPVQFTARLSEALPWSVIVTDSSGQAVASGNGVGPEISWSWDASTAPQGLYAYRIDAGPAVLPVVGTLDSAALVDVSGLKTTPLAFTPNQDGIADEVAISFSLATPAAVTMTLLDASGATVTVLAPERSLPAGPSSLAWNGTLADGSAVPDGRYRVAVSARLGLASVYRSTTVLVDRSLGGLVVSPGVFSPNGDGRLDALWLRFDLGRTAQIRARVLAGKRSLARLFVGELGPGRHALSWAGRKRLGRVRDGSYAVVVEATTELGTRKLEGVFRVDGTPPQVRIGSARTRGGSTKILFRLSEPARVKVWLDRRAFTVEKPAGPVAFWQRRSARWVRVVAWDAAGNASDPVVARVSPRR